MKFDVLKGMMDKTLARSTEGDMDLGEDDSIDTSGIGDMETQLRQSMTSMDMESS